MKFRSPDNSLLAPRCGNFSRTQEAESKRRILAEKTSTQKISKVQGSKKKNTSTRQLCPFAFGDDKPQTLSVWSTGHKHGLLCDIKSYPYTVYWYMKSNSYVVCGNILAEPELGAFIKSSTCQLCKQVSGIPSQHLSTFCGILAGLKRLKSKQRDVAKHE